MNKRKQNLPLAKAHRQSTNPWEHKLWQQLRAHRLSGYKFKRQVPIDEYIVDFCCNSKNLIIELNGSQHSKPSGVIKDKQRLAHLESLGYTILEFWNNEIDSNLEGVLEKIRKSLS